MLNFMPGKKTYTLLGLGIAATLIGGAMYFIDPASQYAVEPNEVIQRLYLLALGATGRKALGD